MSGAIGLILLVTSYLFYHRPLYFLTIQAFSCVFLLKHAWDIRDTVYVLVNLIVLVIVVYQLGQKQKGKI